MSDTYPFFAFSRWPYTEDNYDLVLAGCLIVDLPKGVSPSAADTAEINDIVKGAYAVARSAELPKKECCHIGWRNQRPDDADRILNDNAAMLKWNQNSAPQNVEAPEKTEK